MKPGNLFKSGANIGSVVINKKLDDEREITAENYNALS